MHTVEHSVHPLQRLIVQFFAIYCSQRFDSIKFGHVPLHVFPCTTDLERDCWPIPHELLQDIHDIHSDTVQFLFSVMVHEVVSVNVGHEYPPHDACLVMLLVRDLEPLRNRRDYKAT